MRHFVAHHPSPQHREGDQILAHETVRDSHHRRFQNRRMRFQHLVDLARSDVHPALDDQFLRASDDEEVAVLILVREVAGVQPALRVEDCGGPFGSL